MSTEAKMPPVPMGPPAPEPGKAPGFVPDSDFLALVGHPGGLGDLSDAPPRSLRDPQWYDQFVPDSTNTLQPQGAGLGKVASGHAVGLASREKELPPLEYPGDQKLDAELGELLSAYDAESEAHGGHPEFKDDLISVIEDIDPEGTIDHDHRILDRCLAQASRFRKEYASGELKFPESYLSELYESELRYSDLVVTRALQLVRRNKEQGINVTTFLMMWDLDRSQILVADMPQNKEGYLHIPRPALGPTIDRLREELSNEGVVLANGVITDQPLGKPDVSGMNLEERAVRLFSEVGVDINPDLIISSTNGPIAEKLPEFMKLRRLPNSAGPDGKSRKPTQGEMNALRRRQLRYIRNILDQKAAENPKNEYHSKLGALSELAAQLREEEVIGWADDLFMSVPLANSLRIVGMPITPRLQPKAPDDLMMSEFYDPATFDL